MERSKELGVGNGLRIGAFSGDQAFSLIDAAERERYIAFVKESMAVAKILGCRVLVLRMRILESLNYRGLWALSFFFYGILWKRSRRSKRCESLTQEERK